MRIFLIGFMGSGKSYSGKRLAHALEYPFIDLDDQIEEKEQRKISEVFAREGEAIFRKIERSALHELRQFQKAVISCGGGTPCFFDNMDWMNQNGLTIYLKTPVDILVSRLESEKAHRPLLNQIENLSEFIIKKIKERELYYNQASIIYEQLALDEKVHEILSKNLMNIIGH